MKQRLVLAGLLLFLFGVAITQASQQPIFTNVTPPLLQHEMALANDHLINGCWQEADRDYQNILTHHPEHRGAQLGVASAAMMQGELHRAAIRLRQILEHHPTDPFALAGLAMLVPATNPERHESGLKQAQESAPEVTELHFVLGNFYANQARWQEAERSYARAIALVSLHAAPIAAPYFYNHAIALEYLGDSAASLARYQQALDHTKPHEHALRQTITQRLSALEAIRP